MYLTKHDTELVKTTISRLWETYCGAVILLTLFYPNLFSFFNLSIIFCWALFRLCRRYPRRHDKCAKKGILHGWFFRRQYYRTIPRMQSNTGKREFRIPPPIKEYDFRSECHFEGHCLECGEDYEIKPPVLKSFEHRPSLFMQW